MKMLIQTLSDWLGGMRVLSSFEGEDIPPFHTNFYVDSREMKAGGIFVCIKGEHADGHDFIPDAIKRGAMGIITEKIYPIEQAGVFQIQVDSSLEALKHFSSKLLNEVKPKLIGITGSAGKTTSREIIQTIFETTYPCSGTIKNYNTPIGVPLSLARMPANSQYFIAEISASYPGELCETLSFLSLDHAVITGIGPSHLEFFKNEAGVFKEKINLAKSVKRGGFTWMNGDQRWYHEASSLGLSLKSFGFSSSNEVTIDRLVWLSSGMEFEVSIAKKAVATFKLNAWAKHFLLDALPSIALACQENIPVSDIQKGMASFFPGKGRGRCLQLQQGITILDEAYNANPYSMRSAISALLNIPFSRKILVLGDMLELGAKAEELHKELGAYLADFPQEIEAIIYVGEYGKIVKESSASRANKFLCTSDWTSALNILKKLCQKNTVVFVKASNGMGLHQLVDEMEKAYSC
jgi:UDP-N-acetylmuramoyl-tripeptide--D-alanyl-D-alanine ligase